MSTFFLHTGDGDSMANDQEKKNDVLQYAQVARKQQAASRSTRAETAERLRDGSNAGHDDGHIQCW